MSNKASENLHRLIKSLSKPEKRYFKIYSSRHTLGEKNNYQILFDAIDKQKEYDEEALKAFFAKEAFVKKFSIAKSRLYDAILRSLDAYHANSSIDAQLKRLIHCAEILYKKTLYNQSYKLLRSAKKLAYKHEKHTALLEILTWEKRLVEKDNYGTMGEEEIQKIHAEDSLTLKKIENYNEFWNIKSHLFRILNKRGKARTQEELSNFKAIIDNVLLKGEDEALYYETKYLYYHIYSAYYFGIGDYHNSYKNLIKNVALIESNIDMFKEEPNVYFSVLTNVIYIGSQLKRYQEVFMYLEKLRSIPETLLLNSNEDLDIKLFSSAYSIELTLYALTGEFEKGIELIPVVEDGLKLYSTKINKVRKAYFYFNIAIIYFGTEEYSSALKWINRLLNDIEIEESEDIYCFAQLFNLIIHIELGNQRLIPYALKSTYRYLNTRNRVYKFETIVLNFIKQFLKIKEEHEITTAYTSLFEELQTLEKDTFEKTAFEYFDFISWAESKIEKKPFQSLVKEKATLTPA